MAGVDPATRKKVLRVISISLLLDLISFTFILPLFPKLLEYYRDSEAPAFAVSPENAPQAQIQTQTLLQTILAYLNAYKQSFDRKIDSRHDIAIASPIIGRISDRYGRRNALLASMTGNIFSVLLWIAAVDFRTFLASRVVGGLSEGNVQLATAMATDISDENNRGSTMAIIGACFSIAFSFGPMLGAYLSSIEMVARNPFATAASVSLALIVLETAYLWACLPETLPSKTTLFSDSSASEKQKDKPAQRQPDTPAVQRTNSFALLSAIHFVFLLFFSGMESSLSFMTYDLFGFTSANNGRLLGFVGIVASIIQGGVTRRMPPLRCVRIGVVTCLAAFMILSRVSTVSGLYAAATCLAITSATVVTGLNALTSFEAHAAERG
ncbi:Major facilitator superfamily domain-containing protein 10, partial [Ceratocystis fimbriata CBS 114723]